MDKRKHLKLAGIAVAVIIADQLTKGLVTRHMPLYDSITVIPGFFNLTHIQNPGGAFGLFATQSENIRNVVFLAASTLAVGLIYWLYIKTPPSHPWLATGFALILGGAVGNLIDRVRYGQVVDFLDFNLGFMRWPAFNAADSAITLGIAIFMIHLVLKKMPE